MRETPTEHKQDNSGGLGFLDLVTVSLDPCYKFFFGPMKTKLGSIDPGINVINQASPLINLGEQHGAVDADALNPCAGVVGCSHPGPSLFDKDLGLSHQ
jgi:hypothetical protein